MKANQKPAKGVPMIETPFKDEFNAFNGLPRELRDFINRMSICVSAYETSAILKENGILRTLEMLEYIDYEYSRKIRHHC